MALAICAGYLLLSSVLIGFKPEQVFISALFFLLYTIGKGARRFLLVFLPFIVFWVLFDYMKAIPNFKYAQVHVEDLYILEKKWFGIGSGDARQTLNEFWRSRTHTFLDVMSGFFYLCWIPAPLSFAAYLFVKDRGRALEFSLTFLWVNLVGFIGYYGYPAAPPWYVHLYGFGFDPATPGHVAGLEGFDRFVGLPIFHGLYSKSSNVFAAMPSLHSAYVVISVYYAFLKKTAWGWRFALVLICLGTWFAAIYTDHHYGWDVLAGIFTAIVGILTFRYGWMRWASFRSFLDAYKQKVSPAAA